MAYGEINRQVYKHSVTYSYRMDRLLTTSTVSTGKNESGLSTFVKALSLVWPELAEAGRGVVRLSVE